MSTKKPPKKKGGARPGAGRKKIERPPEVKDPQFAARVLEKIGTKEWLLLLKTIEDYELYASRVVANQTGEPIEKPQDPRTLLTSDADLALFFMACSDRGIAKATFLAFVEKRDGKAMHTVNHLHDKPVQHEVTLSLGEGMKLAMEKAEQRVSSRKH